MNYLGLLLTAVGAFTEAEIRMDDKYTAVLEKQLEYVKAKTYDVVYPEFKARQLIPVSNEAGAGAETIVYRQWDSFGIAQIISNYADDFPMVETLAEEFTQKIQSIGAGFSYSVQDLRRAAMSGVPLSERKARATRRAIEQKIEDIGAAGDTNGGLPGLANNVNVSLVSPVTGTWASATGAQMVADMLHFSSQVAVACKETFIPDTIVLDIASYNRLANTRISTSGDTNMTALNAFLEASPYVTSVISWNKLATANAAGTGPRALCYARTPDVLSFEIPQEYEQFPPQQDNLAFKVPAHARVGGVLIYYPVAVGYMDGL